MSTLRVPARFNGPPGSANGGYMCGLVVGILGGPSCEVSLRAPPPLERDLSVESVTEGVLVHDGDTLIAQARRAPLDLEPTAPVSPARAAEASTAGLERWGATHPFPTCVVCGPERERGDGLRIFPGPLGDGRFAAGWTPDISLAGGDGLVRREYVWAALDCPTSAPLANYGDGPAIVLARLAATVEAPVRVGEAHALVSWELTRDGRKREAACVLLDSAGRTLARTRALWIELR